MTRTNAALVVVTGCVLAGALAFSEVSFAQRLRAPAMTTMRHAVAPPDSPAHGYRHFVRGGIELTFDAQLAVYVVSGYSDRFFHGERFLRRHDDIWQASTRVEGPWVKVPEAEVSPGLQRRYAQKPTPSDSAEDSAVPAKQAQ